MCMRVQQWLVLLAAGAIATATCRQEQIDDRGERAGRRVMPDSAPSPPTVSSGVNAGPLPSPTTEPSATASSNIARVTQSQRYGEDEIIGVLQVTPAAAYYQVGETRISLVQAPPVTGIGTSALTAETARGLRRLAGKRVRALGDLQGTILWEARVMP